MTIESYPIRRKLAAAVAIAGVAATGAACTSEARHTSPNPNRSYASAEAPSGKTVPARPSTGELAPVSEQLGKAETRFQNASIKAAMQLAEDATNPNSFCEVISPTAIGNPKGPAHKAGFPGMLMTFDAKKRQIHTMAITDLHPTEPAQTHIEKLEMVFTERGPVPSILDRKAAAGQTLTPQDYLAFFSDGTFGATSVEAIDGDRYGTMDLQGPTYRYEGSGAATTQAITDKNVQLMNGFTSEVDHISRTLHDGI